MAARCRRLIQAGLPTVTAATAVHLDSEVRQ